jgi:hypothetical protein
MTKPRQPKIFPVLIPTRKGERADGKANFLFIKTADGVFQSGGPVRLLTSQDISKEAIRAALTPEDHTTLTGALDLKDAILKNDVLARTRAYGKLMPRLGWAGVDPAAFATHPGWANLHLPRVASEPLDEARLVLWYAAKVGRFVPALYCPTLRSAIFARAFIDLRTCPHCGDIFFPGKENVVYCRPAHGHAHRIARMRAKQRGKHGKR